MTAGQAKTKIGILGGGDAGARLAAALGADIAALATLDETLTTLVFLVVPPRDRLTLRDSSFDDWSGECLRPLLDARDAIVAARTRLPRLDHLLVVLPADSGSLSVGVAAMCEGVQSLARSAAESWAATGPTVTILLVDGERLASDAAFAGSQLAPLVRDLSHAPSALHGTTILATGR